MKVATAALVLLVAAACATSDGGGSMSADHYVQVGTYPLEKSANEVRDSLRALGYNAYVDQASITAEPLQGITQSTRMVYRVRIGPVSYEDASAIRAKLAVAGVQSVVMTE